MRRITAYLAFFMLSSGASVAQYSLSPRLGEMIDRSERDYFSLFPLVEGFVSAKAELQQDRSVNIIVSRSQSKSIKDTVYSISATAAENLIAYIENFESCRRGERTVNWRFLSDLAASGPALQSKMNENAGITIETMQGEQVHGKLLWADDSLVILWQSSDQYNWRTVNLSARTIPSSDINSMIIEQRSAFWTGAGYGALIGTAWGVILGTMVANGFEYNSSESLFAVAVIGLFGAATTGLVGGVIGGILSSDIDRLIAGNAQKYGAALPILKENAMISEYSPPELKEFEAQSKTIVREKSSARVAKVQEEQIVTAANTVYLEFLGNGHLFSLNYERRIFEDFALRIGYGDNYLDSPSIPLMAYYFWNFGSSNVQFGLGVAVTPNLDDNQYVYLTGSIGYRYQPKSGGFIFEGGFTPIYVFFRGLNPWFGLGVGYAF
ncbi:MAG: hypothetical protein Q8896_07130 [Bacteroidota bacterium]|nr:hypothetical protein [Bacteroidota bacterium]